MVEPPFAEQKSPANPDQIRVWLSSFILMAVCGEIELAIKESSAMASSRTLTRVQARKVTA